MKRNGTEAYKVKVDITDPDTKKGMFSGMTFNLEVAFVCNENDYGNGYYAYVDGKGFSELCYDLRYSTAFMKHTKEEWIKDWANSYWTGKNGAWAVHSIEIKKV